MQVGPWVNVEDCDLCSADNFPEGRLERAILAASEILFVATCRTFTGILSDTIRPSSAVGSGFGWRDFPILADGSRWVPFGLQGLPGVVFGCGCGDYDWSGCRLHGVVHLPGVPVIEVTSVKINGEEVTDWVLVDSRSLWRTGDDGAFWPCCTDPTIPDTDEGSFSVSYTYGVLPNAAGLLACEALACELARSWGGDCDTCRLPRRITSIVREGISAAVLDPLTFLQDGLTGIYEADIFISQFDCKASASRPATVLSPSTWANQPHRVA